MNDDAEGPLHSAHDSRWLNIRMSPWGDGPYVTFSYRGSSSLNLINFSAMKFFYI